MILKPVQLNMNFDVFVQADYTTHCGTCIGHMTTELQDLHDEWGGLPDSYCFENTRIHQLWWDPTQVDFQDMGRQLDMEVVTVSSIKQPPGCTIPWHTDTFYQIRRKFPDRAEPRVRANIHLEDWKMGHFIQYHDIVHTHWRQGQGLLWDNEIPHLGANAGMEPKYTLQVSGFLI